MIIVGVIIAIVLGALFYSPFILSGRISDEEEKRGFRRS